MSLSQAAIALGAGGLVPFAALSRPGQDALDHELWLRYLRRCFGRPSLSATEVQVTYGCVILAFLGGPHWGFALAARPTRARALQLAWGVTPPLVAWPAASLPPPTSIDLVTAGLGTSLSVDALFCFFRLVPLPYLLLRTPLTLVAAASLQSNHYRR